MLGPSTETETALFNPPPRVLITGAAGFLGGALLRRLAREGVAVTGLDLAPAAPVTGAGWIAGGVGALDGGALDGIDTLVHAAWAGYPGTRAEPRFELDRNVADTLDLYRRCRAGGVRRFLFLSSGGTVYGEPAALPIGEDSPLRPISPYGAAKAAAELFLHSLAHGGGPELVTLRLANPFGPGQLPWRGQGAIATALGCALTATPFTLWGSGAAERDYLYLADVTDALAAAVRAGAPTGTFNIGSGTGRSLEECLAVIEAATGHPIRREAAGERGVDVAHNVLDARRFAAAFGWAPRTDFADGVARHRDWLLANRARWSPPSG